ncbi:hypothetical protein MMC22_006425 [Lobaria immixta]|nr:hypothetical protein [Lobaria immixta]
MDGLSAAASLVAVGSVAVQLADGIKKLRDFWCSIKDAPDEVRAIAADLVVFSRILADISLEAQDQSPSTDAALLRCIDGTKSLAAIVEDLEPGFESKSARTRKWSALKTVFKGEKIKRYQSSLEGMKTSLILAQQSHYGYTNLRS